MWPSIYYMVSSSVLLLSFVVVFCYPVICSFVILSCLNVAVTSIQYIHLVLPLVYISWIAFHWVCLFSAWHLPPPLLRIRTLYCTQDLLLPFRPRFVKVIRGGEGLSLVRSLASFLQVSMGSCKVLGSGGGAPLWCYLVFMLKEGERGPSLSY